MVISERYNRRKSSAFSLRSELMCASSPLWLSGLHPPARCGKMSCYSSRNMVITACQSKMYHYDTLCIFLSGQSTTLYPGSPSISMAGRKEKPPTNDCWRLFNAGHVRRQPGEALRLQLRQGEVRSSMCYLLTIGNTGSSRCASAPLCETPTQEKSGQYSA